MTTKEQERQALEKIKAIVEGLGEDSYVGKAFEGCFEIAEENIENDFFISMKETAQRYLDAFEDAQDAINEWEAKATKAEAKATEMGEQADKYFSKFNDTANRFNNAIAENVNLQKVIDEKDMEIMKLKAKLYDLMNA